MRQRRLGLLTLRLTPTGHRSRSLRLVELTRIRLGTYAPDFNEQIPCNRGAADRNALRSSANQGQSSRNDWLGVLLCVWPCVDNCKSVTGGGGHRYEHSIYGILYLQSLELPHLLPLIR